MRKSCREFEFIDYDNKYGQALPIPKLVFLDGKRYTGEATFINGYNGYDSTYNDGFLGVFKSSGNLIGFLRDKDGLIIKSKNRRGITLIIK